MFRACLRMFAALFAANIYMFAANMRKHAKTYYKSRIKMI